MPVVLSAAARAYSLRRRRAPALFTLVALFVAIPLCGTATTLASSEISVITLDGAIALALRQSGEIAIADRDIEAAEAAVTQAAARPNPEAGLLLEDLRKDTRTTTVQVNQTLELGDKRVARIQAAERGRDAAMSDKQVRIAEVRANTILAFFDVLAAQERRDLASSAFALAERATNAASRRVAAGKVSPVEETKARVAQAGLQIDLRQAESELGIARQRLCALWARSAPCFEKADGRVDALPALPSFEALASRLNEAPIMMRARAEVAQRTALAGVERSRRTQNITVTVGVKRVEDLGRNQAVLGASMPLPLFDRNQGNLLEALRRSDRARDELQVTATRARTELYASYSQWKTAQDEAHLLLTDVLPGAQSAYDAAVKGFEYGKFGYLDVLDAQRTLLQSKSQYLHALGAAQRYAAEVQRLLGELPAMSNATSPNVTSRD